jgi:hypothetical protein
MIRESFNPNWFVHKEILLNQKQINGATAVSFSVVPATHFKVDSDTQITAVVGLGATGKITVITGGGTATSSQTFAFMQYITYLPLIKK